MISTDQFEEKLDMLKLYFNSEFQITDKVIVHKPTVQDIIDYDGGEDAFFSTLYVFIGNTTFFKIALWDNGIDWNTLEDFQMFCSMVQGMDVSKTRPLFGDLDFSKLKPYQLNPPDDSEGKEGQLILYDPENEIEINELTYFRFRNYLRYMFNIFPKVQTGIKGKKRIKEEIIRTDRQKAKRDAEKSSGSFLFPMISFCLNHPGFKYRKDELGEMGIVEFMDSVYRIQNTEQCQAILHGMMSGFVDGKKIKPEQYNFMKDLVMKQKDIREEIKDATNNPSNYNDVMKQTLNTNEKEK